MNARQLEKLGVPGDCIKSAILAIQNASEAGLLRTLNVKQVIKDILDRPNDHLLDPNFGQFARDVLESGAPAEVHEPIAYRTWGDSGIDAQSHVQMKQACALPMACGAALMPDAHVGYGLPIGGVLALDNAVVPYAVGVDIACRMKLSVFDLAPESLETKFPRYENALERGTRFGVGAEYKQPMK